MADKIIATARIRLTVEVSAGCSWTPNCSVEQVHAAAGEEAMRFLEALFLEKRTAASGRHPQIVDKPMVTVVAITKEQSNG